MSDKIDHFVSQAFIKELMDRYEIPPSFYEELSELLHRIPFIIESEYDHKKNNNKFDQYAKQIRNIHDIIFPPNNEQTDEQISLLFEVKELKSHLQSCIDILERHHHKADNRNLDIIAACDLCSSFWAETLSRKVRRSDTNIAEHDNERFIWDILSKYFFINVPKTREYHKDLFEGLNNALRTSREKYK